MALFCGVMHGQRDLAAFARTLFQRQLRALRFRCERRTGKVRCPDQTTFFRVLGGVDERLLEAALLAWQRLVLGPAQDELIVIEGKKLCHARGVEFGQRDRSQKRTLDGHRLHRGQEQRDSRRARTSWAAGRGGKMHHS